MQSNPEPGEPPVTAMPRPTPAPVSVDLVASSFKSSDFPADWSRERRELGALRYQQWLTLKQLHPRTPVAPTREIDLFWHLHMLSPVAYVRDCQSLFGFVLDHDGGFGATPEELPLLKEVFLATEQRWLKAFGVPYRDDGSTPDSSMTNCWHDCSGRCWHACSE